MTRNPCAGRPQLPHCQHAGHFLQGPCNSMGLRNSMASTSRRTSLLHCLYAIHPLPHLTASRRSTSSVSMAGISSCPSSEDSLASMDWSPTLYTLLLRRARTPSKLRDASLSGVSSCGGRGISAEPRWKLPCRARRARHAVQMQAEDC